MSDFVDQAVTTGKIRMMTTGEEVRQFIHIDDVCEAWYMALSNNLKGVHDVTSFEWVKIVDVARMIGEITGAEVIPGERVGSTPLTPISGKIPGWNPKVNLREGIERMIGDIKNIAPKQ